MEIHAVVEEKINNDTDFQTSLESLSDEEKEQAVSTKRSELINKEFELANQKFNDQRTRAEKAEQELKKNKPVTDPTVKTEGGLTAEDVLAFTGEGITHKEDIELARTWSKNSGKPVGEILSDETFRAVLGVKQEQRKTASTTQVKGGARGVGKVSDEELLKKREKGEILADEDLEKAIEHKYESRRTANKR